MLVLLLGLTVVACGDAQDDPVDTTGGESTGTDSDLPEVVDLPETTQDTTEVDTGEPACDPPAAVGEPAWQVLDLCRAEGQLLGVWGTGRNNVWAVGAKGQVVRFDGCTWTMPDPGTTSDLWWVFGFEDGPVSLIGADGTILKWTVSDGFEAMDSGVTLTIFGMWGAAPNDLWAVGFVNDNAQKGEILRYDGTSWSKVVGLPDVGETPNYFKVWGSGKNDVWVVGRDDLVLHWDGSAWSDRTTGLGTDWITVTGTSKDDVVIVGGSNGGAVAQMKDGKFESVGPDFLPAIQGVCLHPNGTGVATGLGATFLKRTDKGDWEEDWAAPFDLFFPSEPPVEGCQSVTPDYHACFADGEGGTYVVGGNFFAGLTEGVILYNGPPIPTEGL